MFRRTTLALLFVFAGFVAGLVVTGRMRTAADSRAETAAAVAPDPAQRPERPPVVSVGPDFTGIAARAVKGVANISSLQVVRTAPNVDPIFRYFFGDDDALFGPRDRRSLSLGSGVIISEDG